MLAQVRGACEQDTITILGVRPLHTTPFPRQPYAQSGQVDWMRVVQSVDAATSNRLPVHLNAILRGELWGA